VSPGVPWGTDAVRRRPSRRTVVALMVGAGLTVLGGLGMLAAGRPPATAPAGQDDVATTTVTRETLVDVTTVPGKLAYGPEQPVESRLAGTLTALPPVGATIQRGETLFRIDDQPVVLLYGTLPAYRELTAGRAAATTRPTPAGTPPANGTPDIRPPTSPADDGVPATAGADVRQFEENLKALGYSGFTVDERYTRPTAAAVRRWQESLGLAATGTVELGRVFYAPGPVRIAAHELTPGSVATGPVLTLTGAIRLVTAALPQHDQALAKPRTRVTLALPDGKEVPGTVVSVSAATEESVAGGEEPTVNVVVALNDRRVVDDLDVGEVEVRFVARTVADVLVVPINALVALAEGGYGLEVVEGGATRVVAVTTGLFANGKVEISGPGVRDGTTVRTAR
jgi:multidrug efflux system membrane fusion protein